jgi:hypothetical protein
MLKTYKNVRQNSPGKFTPNRPNSFRDGSKLYNTGGFGGYIAYLLTPCSMLMPPF